MATDKKKNDEQAAVGGTAAGNTASMSQRDRYRSRVAESNPDLNMDDEEAYYGAANQRLDDLESLNNGVNNLRSVMDSNPYFAQMIAEAKKQKDFNPILFLIENGELDLDALKDDPEYAAKIADAQTSWTEKQNKGKELEMQMEQNLPASLDACKAKAQEMGLSDEQYAEVIGKVFDMLDEIEKGNISVDIFELLAKGQNYDADVANAEEQGAAQGRATKVRETMRQMPKQTARSGGSQVSGREKSPERQNSMFGL